MTANQPTPVILDDEALVEIEEHARKAPNGAEGWRVPALCQTVRALRAERDMLASGVAGEVLHESLVEQENTALREQLAENARRHFDDARNLERQRDEAQTRLTQVEKERDDARQKLMRRCSHPNTYPLKETTRRCHDCGAEILL